MIWPNNNERRREILPAFGQVARNWQRWSGVQPQLPPIQVFGKLVHE
jgi:hypothetical protein